MDTLIKVRKFILPPAFQMVHVVPVSARLLKIMLSKFNTVPAFLADMCPHRIQ